MRFTHICAVVLALAACQKAAPPTANQSAAVAPGEGIKGVHRDHKGAPIPDVKVIGAGGKEVALRGLASGKPLLLNLWASWCAPCVKELPTLQAMRGRQSGALTVLPVSQDDGPHASVEAFLKAHKLDFAAYQDPKMVLSGALGPDTVLPTTILYDANGKEVWRYIGDLDWTGPEAAKLLAEAPQ